jgi:hypothetical protein
MLEMFKKKEPKAAKSDTAGKAGAATRTQEAA